MGLTRTGAHVRNGETDRWARLPRPVLKEQEIFLPPNQFLSYAHTEGDIERSLEVDKVALTWSASILGFPTDIPGDRYVSISDEQVSMLDIPSIPGDGDGDDELFDRNQMRRATQNEDASRGLPGAPA